MPRNMGTCYVGDLKGLADFETDDNGKKVATKFMPPDWAKEMIEFCSANPDKHAILLLDEINRSRRDVMQAIFPLILENRLGQVVFPKNFYVAAAMNPNTSDYQVADASDEALQARFSHIKITPSKQDWFDYARSQKIDDSIVSFLHENPKMMIAQYEDFSIPKKPTLRLWEMVDRVVKVNPPVQILEELVCGLVGVEAGIGYLKSLKDTVRPVKGLEVLNDYINHRQKIMDLSSYTNPRQDLLNYTKDSLLDELRTTESLKEEQVENLVNFLDDLPKDIALDLARQAAFEPCMQEVIKTQKMIKVLRRIRGKKDESVEAEK